MAAVARVIPGAWISRARTARASTSRAFTSRALTSRALTSRALTSRAWTSGASASRAGICGSGAWDARRLLRFLAGMVLIALAFAMPALSSPPEAPEPAIVVTTVDAPMSPGLSGRIVVPDRPAADGLATSLLETPAGSPAAGTPLVIGSAPLPLSGSAHHGDRAERAPPQI